MTNREMEMDGDEVNLKDNDQEGSDVKIIARESNTNQLQGDADLSITDFHLLNPSKLLDYRENEIQHFPLPFKLYYILEKNVSPDIISWLSDGRCFQIKDGERFCSEIGGTFFRRKLISMRSYMYLPTLIKFMTQKISTRVSKDC